MKKGTPKPLTDKHLLCAHCDAKIFKFRTTDELPDLTEFIGQARALEAVEFGIQIDHAGYHLFALGPPGVGKRSVIEKILNREAPQQKRADDWCYVYNFEKPKQPLAIKLPAGSANTLRVDVKTLIEDLLISLPSLFESEEYRTQLQKIQDEFVTSQERLFKKLEEEAKANDLSILTTQNGFVVAAAKKDGKTLTNDEFAKLSPEKQSKKEELIKVFTGKLKEILKKVPELQRKRRYRENEVQRAMTIGVVAHYIDELKEKYSTVDKLQAFFDAMQSDIVANVKDFLKREENSEQVIAVNKNANSANLFRYEVNVIVDHSKDNGAPVIFEDNPSYPNLIGRMEYVSQFGTLLTNFTLIMPGALHKANGGYLVLDISKVLQQPFAWQELKNALYEKKITIDLPTQVQGFISTVSLEPEPIPLDIKVILLGDRTTYYLLTEFDPDFNELFKVAVDFAEEIERTPQNMQLFAQLLATLIRKEKLKPFQREAIARVIDHGSRLVEDSKKISIHIRSIMDLLREADYFAGVAGKKEVAIQDVQTAIAKQIYRLDRIRDEIHEEIKRKIILLDISGKRIGQINGLSVVELGEFIFAYPARITATVHLGKGEVIDIQKEVDLSGPIHSKSVLVLASFLRGRFTRHTPLSLTANLVFEQVYGPIEGDSASIAELCALISAITNVPMKQFVAITGSINQYGEVQPIGFVNEKIEGFFAICKQQGLTRKQGVIIPQANVQHLMLNEEIISAIQAKEFFIYPVGTIDEVLTLLTDKPAGELNKFNHYPNNSMNYLIEKSLHQFTKRAKKDH